MGELDTAPPGGRQPELGLGRGKVFPAARAASLLNPARRLVQSPARTVAAIGLTRRSRVVELGCGPGFFSPQLAAAAHGGQVVLVDLQAEMLQLARPRLPAGAPVSYVQADGARLPLASGQFDAVFIATVLGEIPDPRACLSEARRVLTPGGVLAVAETRRDSDFLPMARLRAIAEAAGFRWVRRRGMRWQYVALFQPT